MQVELNEKNVINEANEQAGLRNRHFAESSKIIASALYEIIEKHKSSYAFAKEKMDELRNDIVFCQKHKFDIEADAKLKVYSGMGDVYYSCKNFLEDIEKYTEALDL